MPTIKGALCASRTIRNRQPDLSPAYTKGITRYFPNARQVAAPFHIAQMVHQALDQTRRQETKRQPQLKSSRYLWLKHKADLNDTERTRLPEYETQPLQTVSAYHLKEEFAKHWQLPEAQEAADHLDDWNHHIQKSDAGLVFRQMAQNLIGHKEIIINYQKTSRRITNGISEAINGLIDTLNARARGFTNPHYLTNIIFLTQGKLNFALPTLNDE